MGNRMRGMRRTRMGMQGMDPENLGENTRNAGNQGGDVGNQNAVEMT